MRYSLADPALLRLGQLVTDELGITMPRSKLYLLKSRLQRRMLALGLASYADYEAYLLSSSSGTGEHTHFRDVVTTNTTHFFREPEHFSRLVGHVLAHTPRYDGGSARGPCRVWCAGCSTGQEAYTLAMVLSDYASLNPGFTFAITASDISSAALAHARRAIYTLDEAQSIPAALRMRFLLRSKERNAGVVRIAPELRKHVHFAQINFMDAEYPHREPFDVIFFRNVMIYFAPDVQERVVNHLCQHLRSGGHLFVSHTETLTRLRAPLVPIDHSIYRRL